MSAGGAGQGGAEQGGVRRNAQAMWRSVGTGKHRTQRTAGRLQQLAEALERVLFNGGVGDEGDNALVVDDGLCDLQGKRAEWRRTRCVRGIRAA